MTDKIQILSQIREKVAEELGYLKKSMDAAYEETTHTETKQEGKYDTRAIEAGYLAGAQSERYRIMSSHLAALERLIMAQKGPLESAGAGSVVILVSEEDDMVKRLVLIPNLGGYEAVVDDLVYTSITLDSAIGRVIYKKFEGDEVTLQIKGQKKQYILEKIL